MDGDVGIPKGIEGTYPGMVAVNWVVFGVLIIGVVGGVVWLARLTAQIVDGELGQDASERDLAGFAGGSRWVLYGNVVVSHGLFGGLVLGIAWISHIPVAAFSVGEVSRSFIGIGIGVVLYGMSEAVKFILPPDQLVYSEQLRELLAPTTRAEWSGLVCIVLPLVAVVEEVLFRGALIGAFSFGFGISPWALAVVSSVLFGIGHGIQGRVGVVATGMLGGLLAGVFILTNSLVVVIVAHYFINLLEFVVHEYVTDLIA